MSVQAQPKYPIESVDNALRLLLFVSGSSSVGVVEASRHLGVAPSTAHRLLAMLQHHGLVERDTRTQTYRAGPALTDLGLAALRGFEIRAIARPFLEELVAQVGETAHFAILRGTSILFLDGVETDKALRAGSRVGQRLPAHATAAGKAQLAVLPDATIRDLYPETLPAATGATKTTRDALMRDLAEVRRRGYATNRGESEDHLAAVAVAIRDGAGMVRGAITVAGPDVRLRPGAFPSLGRAISATVERIGDALGPSA